MELPAEASIKHYRNRESLGLWGGLVGGFGTFIVLLSTAGRSLILTFGFVVGTALVWYLGHLALSKSYYFISPTSAGFKDLFRTREVQFSEIRSVTKSTWKNSSTVIFVCEKRTVTMPFDPIDKTWFSTVRAELDKRGIPVSSIAFGFLVKEG